MTYLWSEGDPVLVEADARGFPQRMTWQGRNHRVRQIANRWRVDEGWWFQHVRREYFKLITDSGLLLTIFHDLLSDSWCVQRLYD